MMANVIFPLLVLSAIYGIVILGLVLLLCKMGVSGKGAIILSFLLFGAVTGILTAWVWPIAVCGLVSLPLQWVYNRGLRREGVDK
jgi:hypothetical protein